MYICGKEVPMCNTCIDIYEYLWGKMWGKCFDKKISLAEKNQTQTHEDNPVSMIQ